jgi:hypothetical protein
MAFHRSRQAKKRVFDASSLKDPFSFIHRMSSIHIRRSNIFDGAVLEIAIGFLDDDTAENE